jgi:hypothetical protein
MRKVTYLKILDSVDIVEISENPIIVTCQFARYRTHLIIFYITVRQQNYQTNIQKTDSHLVS